MQVIDAGSVWVSKEDDTSLVTRIALVTSAYTIGFHTYVKFTRVRVVADTAAPSTIKLFGKVSRTDFEWTLRDFLDAYEPVKAGK